MPPNLSGLKLFEPRVAQIGVYMDSPPDSTQIGLNIQSEYKRLFDALGPCLGVELRHFMYRSLGMNYVMTSEDNSKANDLNEAFYALFKMTSMYTPNSTTAYSMFYNAVYELIRLHSWYSAGALYELHISQIRYVWNFKLPESDAPIDHAVQKLAWGYLRSVFRYMERPSIFAKVLYEPASLGPASLERPNEQMVFTKHGTPFVNFVSENIVDGNDISYQLLTAYWSAKARLKWSKSVSKATLIAKINQAWIELYTETHFKPGGPGAKRARDEFFETMNKVQKVPA